MASNIYTTQFATKSEMHTEINQTAEDITLETNQKLSNYSTTNEMNSAINVKADEISSVVSTKVGENEIISKINQSSEAVAINANKISLNGKEINLTSDDITISSDTLQIDTDGKMTLQGNETQSNIQIISSNDINRKLFLNPAKIIFFNNTYGHEITMYNSAAAGTLELKSGIRKISLFNDGTTFTTITLTDGTNTTTIDPSGIITPQLTQTSLESIKKNISESDINALELIKNSKIYTYNLKTEKDADKKHIGFVIGDKYKTPEEVISKSKDGIDTYTMSSIMWKALQEQQKIIEDLQKEIKLLKGEKDE